MARQIAIQPRFVSFAAFGNKLTSPLTTKGDLLTRNSTDHIRVGVGPDGYILIADSSQEGGIKWGPPPETGTAGYTTIQSDGASLTQRDILDIIGASLIVSDDNTNAKTKLTLSQTPTNSTSVVGSGRQINTSSPLTGGGSLTSDLVLGMPRASTSVDGYLAAEDYIRFDNSSFSVADHEIVDSLVHNLAEDSFEQYVYSGANVVSIVVWETSAMLKKIRESNFVYSGPTVVQEINIQYNSGGIEVQRVATDYNYSGSVLISSTNTEVP